MATLYEAAGGIDGLIRLAEAWHERVVVDDVVGHAFSHGSAADHTDRLAGYWAEALGGPELYTGKYGDESSVVRIHSGNGEHDELNHRAVACFDAALSDVGLTGQPVAQALHDYFEWATWTTMYRSQDRAADLPDGLPIPRWSWNGLDTSSEPGSDHSDA